MHDKLGKATPIAIGRNFRDGGRFEKGKKA